MDEKRLRVLARLDEDRSSEDVAKHLLAVSREISRDKDLIVHHIGESLGSASPKLKKEISGWLQSLLEDLRGR